MEFLMWVLLWRLIKIKVIIGDNLMIMMALVMLIWLIILMWYVILSWISLSIHILLKKLKIKKIMKAFVKKMLLCVLLDFLVDINKENLKMTSMCYRKYEFLMLKKIMIMRILTLLVMWKF
jgi:hypothetical protein